MRHLIATVLVCLSAAFAPATSLAAAPEGATGTASSLESVVDAELPASGSPGLAYAVVTDGEVTEEGARGVMRAGSDAPVTARTPFAIGSITKSFTALAVMQLVEAGQVELDGSIATYVTDFEDQPAAAITVHELLSHTSGYSTLQGNTPHTDGGGADGLEGAVAALATEAPAYEPGTVWEYSNANYQVLGRLIEVVAGASFADYVTGRILEPVGMEDSFVADGEDHPEMATGHTPWFWTKRPNVGTGTDLATAPQGGVLASAHDVALYLAMMMNGEDDVLSADGKARMMRPASPTSPHYGLGWYVDPGQGTVGHSGATPGVETQATMVPAGDDAVVVLVNAGSGVGFGETTQLRYAITATALDLAYAGEGSRWAQKALFLFLVLAPLIYLASMVWAWVKRDRIRAKTSGVAGLFSLWFPLLTTAVAAWVVLALVPNLMGAPLATVRIFQPDMALAMTATGVMGVVWALFRLAVAYTGPSRPGPR